MLEDNKIMLKREDEKKLYIRISGKFHKQLMEAANEVDKNLSTFCRDILIQHLNETKSLERQIQALRGKLTE